MRKWLLLVLFSILFIDLHADICFTTFQEDSANADVIFVGKVIEITRDIFWHRSSPNDLFTFEIIESYKGISKYHELISVIGPVYGCCNVPFVMDSIFLVFAYGDGEKSMTYWTNDCSLSDLLSESIHYVSDLGEPVIPQGNGWDKRFFAERTQKLIDVDSANKKIDKEEHPPYSTYIIIFLSLLVLWLGYSKIRG